MSAAASTEAASGLDVISMGVFAKAKAACWKTEDAASVEGSDASDQTDFDVADFPAQQRFWRGSDYELLGSGIRYYKIGFINIKARPRDKFEVAPAAKHHHASMIMRCIVM